MRATWCVNGASNLTLVVNAISTTTTAAEDTQVSNDVMGCERKGYGWVVGRRSTQGCRKAKKRRSDSGHIEAFTKDGTVDECYDLFLRDAVKIRNQRLGISHCAAIGVSPTGELSAYRPLPLSDCNIGILARTIHNRTENYRAVVVTVAIVAERH